MTMHNFTLGIVALQMIVAVFCGGVADLRIAELDPSNPNEGRIEIRPYGGGGEWEVICNHGWGDVDAQVACRHMGFTGPSTFIPHAVDIGTSNLPYNARRYRCDGTEDYLDSCSTSTANCDAGNEAGVSCRNDEEYDIRLVGGSNEREGRLEVFLGGIWGTVCQRGVQMSDAYTLCNQLGFPSYYPEVRKRSHFGPGSGPIHIMNLGCNPIYHDTLEDCHWDAPTAFCHHGRDVSIICGNPNGCPRGTYAEAGAYLPCSLCPVDTYQARPAQSDCTSCPAQRSTLGEGSSRRDQCLEFYGDYDVSNPARSIASLGDNESYMPHGTANSDRVQMINGLVVAWKVEIYSTDDPVDLVMWRDLGGQEFEHVGGTTIESDALGERYIELEEADQFAVQHGDRLGLIWYDGPVVPMVPVPCDRPQSFRLNTDAPGATFEAGDRTIMPVEISEICVSFNVQAVIKRIYP